MSLTSLVSTYSVCPPLSGVFNLAYCSLGSFSSVQILDCYIEEKIVHEYTVYNKYFYTTFLSPILLSRDIWVVSMPWLLQIQSHSWDCGHIPKKLIAFPLDICQKWVWQTVGLFYINLLRNFHFIFKNSSTIYITTNSAVKILCFLYCACTVLYVLCLFWQGQEWITENPALAWQQESCGCPAITVVLLPSDSRSHLPLCHRTLWLFAG